MLELRSDYIMKNSVILLLSNYYSDNQINKNEMVEAIRIIQRREATYNNKFVGNPEWKTSLEIPKYVEENNTDMHVLIKKTGCVGAECFRLNQDRIQYCVLANKTIKLQFP